MATYIKGTKLQWENIWSDVHLEKDNAGRWVSSEFTPQPVVEYLENIRPPSRAYPHSYAKALLTQKFAKYAAEKMPNFALNVGVAQ